MVDVVGQKEDVSSRAGLYKLCCLAQYRTRLFCRQVATQVVVLMAADISTASYNLTTFSHGITPYYTCNLDSFTTFLMNSPIATFLTLLLFTVSSVAVKCFRTLHYLLMYLAGQNQSRELKVVNVSEGHIGNLCKTVSYLKYKS